MLRLGFIVAPGFKAMGLDALSVFEFADLSAGGPFYDVHLLSETGSVVRSYFDTVTLRQGGKAVGGRLTWMGLKA